MPVSEQYQIAGRTSREIAESVEAGIREGRLAPGDRLPAIRALAAGLGVSPGTVSAAYRALRTRGLVMSLDRSATVVSPRPALPVAPVAKLAPEVRDLRIGLPDAELLPDLGPVLARVGSGPRLPSRHETRNDARLLELAAARLAADGVEADHLAVVGGALDGVERVLAAHVARGDRVAVEDPCYPAVLDLLGVLGVVPEPVAVDDEGMVPGALEAALDRGVVAVLVTPRAQSPTGAALTPGRAVELRRLLSSRRVLLVEDDYAHAIAGTEAVTLTDAASGSWAVIRSVSKSLSPDLRLAVVAGDATTIARVEGRQALGTGWVSTVLQRTVAALWEDPAVEELTRRAREVYGERRRALIAALAAHGIAARGLSGINVWVPVRDEARTVEALLAAGWAVAAGERFRLKSPPAVRVTTATLRPEDAVRLAADLAAAQRTVMTAGTY